MKRIACVLFSLFLLAGCTAEQEDVSSLQSEVPVSSSEIVSSEPPLIEYDDLLSTMGGCGKDLVASGDLQNEEYTEALTELETILDGYKHNVSLVVYSLDNRKAVCYNTDAEIFGACTVKAAYTYYCCLQLDNGVGSLDTQRVYEKKHYESGTGDMQYNAFGTLFTVRTMLDKSMRISDNVGYMMAVDYFGRDGYNQWVHSLGCDSLIIKPTVWSLKTKAKDLAVMWREMYNYFGSDAAHAQFLYNSCTNTDGNYATAALENVTYSHKQGHNRSGDWHSLSDAGIVWGESPYIIAIITDAPGPSDYDAGVFAEIINIVDGRLF